jgi:hypothetical protein
VKILPKDISFLANDLIQKLERELSSQLKTIGDILIDDVREHIDSDVYAKYNPPEPIYERTENLKRSIKKTPIDKTVNGISIDVYADDDIAKSHHMYDSKNPFEPYAGIVETGEGYDFNYPFGYNRPRPFMKNTIEKNSDSIASLIDKAVGDAIKKL